MRSSVHGLVLSEEPADSGRHWVLARVNYGLPRTEVLPHVCSSAGSVLGAGFHQNEMRVACGRGVRGGQ